MKAFAGEKKNFETLTARFAWDVLEQLRGLHAQSDEFESKSNSRGQLAQIPPGELGNQLAITAPRPVFTIEIDEPELAGHGAFIPQFGTAEASDWGVLTETDGSREQASGFFELVATLPGRMDDRSFVSLCYTYFLGRPADEDGLRQYTDVLQGRQISRRDIMKLLLESEEALSRRKRIALIPDPTLWLANYIPEHSANDPFPFFDIRY